MLHYSLFTFIFVPILCYYKEEVQIDRVRSDLVNSALLFKFEETVYQDSPLYLNTLYQLLDDNRVVNLEFSTSQGFWRSDLFGQTKHPSSVSGVHVIAAFEDVTDSDFYWKRLISQLNGMLCTAVLGLGDALYSKPVISSSYWANATKLYYGAFTGDSVCTENIDSFKKLLPCQTTGFTRLLGSPKYLYETKFTSAGLHVNREKGVWSGNVIFTFLKAEMASKTKFSEIFGSTLTTTCHISNENMISIDGYSHSISSFDINSTTRDWNVNFKTVLKEDEPLLRMYSFTRFKNLLTGRFVSTLKSDTAQKVIYTHLIPWQISVWYSTISVVCNGAKMSPEIRSTPGLAKKTPTLIEINFSLPEKSSCQVLYEFEKSFLYMMDYPPDANHGITIPGAIVTLTTHPDVKYYSEPTVITLPSPDVTMPYNVVCFIGTMGALIFQIVFACTTQYQTITELGPPKLKKLVVTAQNKLRRLLKH